MVYLVEQIKSAGRKIVYSYDVTKNIYLYYAMFDFFVLQNNVHKNVMTFIICVSLIYIFMFLSWISLFVYYINCSWNVVNRYTCTVMTIYNNCKWYIVHVWPVMHWTKYYSTSILLNRLQCHWLYLPVYSQTYVIRPLQWNNNLS